jgi:16S rRNA (adenine(1408)-N(1))-methyltransferase
VIVVEGRRTRDMPAAELDERLAAAAPSRIVVDLGTGDGRFAYTAAAAHPDWFVVGVDALSERLADYSAKALRKRAKGGLPNALFVRASAEQPPPELRGRADDVRVLLPWGALLVGLVDPPRRPAVLDGIAALAHHQGADLTIVLNAEPWEESTPKDMADLPPVTVDSVEHTLKPAYAERGITVVETRELTEPEVKDLATTWARRLAASHRGHPRFVLVRARMAPRPEA